MIVILDDMLFLREHADDALLLAILRQGSQGRFAVRTRPAFHREGERPANIWIELQSENAADTAHRGFERGLRWKTYQWPDERSEPEVILEIRKKPSWPRSLDTSPARLPLGDDANDFLNRPLCLLVEDKLSDMGFLGKTLPQLWRNKWQRAVKRRWLEPEHGGGLTNMRRIIEEDVAHDTIRRLRLWALFDSDAVSPGKPSDASRLTKEACTALGLPFHQLERRMIENYIPQRAMRDWATKVAYALKASSDKKRHHERANKLLQRVDEYWALAPEQRHHQHLKDLLAELVDKPAKDRGFSGPADVWRGDGDIDESDFLDDEWEQERTTLFRSLFGSL
jgi:hypothetical protein